MNYKVRCNKVESNDSNLRGLGTIVIDDKFVINGVRLVKRDDGFAVHYPSRKCEKEESGYRTIAYPGSKELAAKLAEAMAKSVFEEGAYKVVDTDTPFSLSVKVTPYEKESLLGFCEVYFDDKDHHEFVLNDITLRKGKDGTPFLAMPNHKKRDPDEFGNPVYADVMNPITKEFYTELNEMVQKEYERSLEKKEAREREESVYAWPEQEDVAETPVTEKKQKAKKEKSR